MKEIRLFVLSMLAIYLLAMPGIVTAQEEAPWVVKVTRPVDAGVRAAVEAWMGSESAPVQTTYWAITYTKPYGLDTIVSIVALNLSAPDEKWRITDDDKVLWMGTVIVDGLDNSVEMYSTDPYDAEQTNATPKIAVQLQAAGGGSYVRFPWQAGGQMMYGPRGVHAAGGGGEYATGFLAVDFVGGDDMGSGVAPPRVYAVTAGVVDYVCADSTSTLIRTYNSSTNDYFIYAHLIDNANLEMDHAFSQNQLIGNLKYGSFDDTCGWAEQKANHYHLHFGFQAANNAMRMENCILDTNTQKWACGTKVVSTGQFLIGGGGGGGGGGTGETTYQPGFWDYLLAGSLGLFRVAIVNNLPAHEEIQFVNVLYSSIRLTLQVAYVMVRSNINLTYLAAIALLGIRIKILFMLIETLVFLFKLFKSLVPFS